MSRVSTAIIAREFRQNVSQRARRRDETRQRLLGFERREGGESGLKAGSERQQHQELGF